MLLATALLGGGGGLLASGGGGGGACSALPLLLLQLLLLVLHNLAVQAASTAAPTLPCLPEPHQGAAARLVAIAVRIQAER